ncbi:hypothetical protein TrVE_jg6763 [Triparma verrucosa]|uniref:Uncharacterized protein n=1 Tax=Triparma verrucosa TaxID=1606542 RepID=A0A9W7FJP7_9STRA|nr:hypothetical protein TrVE_jg6763 [Triparma verrucosa]
MGRTFIYDAPPVGNRAQRPQTPSNGRHYGATAAFKSSSDRFKYIGRQTPKEVYPDPPVKSRDSNPQPKKKVDNRSETITGMTFAKAMGLDDREFKPRGQTRDAIFKEVLLDYEPYDHSKDEVKRRRNMGFAVDKMGRNQSERFYGTAWRGCANLTPTNLPDNPTPYMKPGNLLKKKTFATSVFDSKSDRLTTTDGFRLNLMNVPRSKSAVNQKLGPGTYGAVKSKAFLKSQGFILDNVEHKSSSFQAPSRRKRECDTWDVFRTSNLLKKSQEGAKKAATNSPESKYSIYKLIKPTSSTDFLKECEVDDKFHSYLKRTIKGEETEEEAKVRAEVWKNFKGREEVEERRRRLDSQELLLTEEITEDDDI